MSTLLEAKGQESVAGIYSDLADQMMDKASVFRDAGTLTSIRETLAALRNRYQRVKIQDHGKIYNTDLTDTIELGMLLDLAEVLVESALQREESRGAHYREDFPHRDDANWLKHTLAYKGEQGINFKYKPVTITKFQPQERKY